MKNILALLALVTLPCFVFGADGFAVSVQNKLNTTNSVSTEYAYSGYIESLYVDVTGTTTGTLVVASASSGETLLTATVTADATYRPRYVTVDNAASQLTAGTNTWARYLMNNEKLTLTLSETASVTNTYKIYFKLDK